MPFGLLIACTIPNNIYYPNGYHGMDDDRGAAEAQCPVRATVRLLGGKYKSVIVWGLKDGRKRFSEIQALVPEATSKMVTKQLRELEADGIVHREVYPVVPPKTEYWLTDFGTTAIPLIMAMSEWGISYLEREGLPVADCARLRGCPGRCSRTAP